MPHILLIDDDELFRPMIKVVMEHMGHTVVAAEEGREGMALYEREPFDLVLTDLIMPDQEGVETIMKLRKLNPAVKIIAMSGGGRVKPEGYLDIARRVGADATLKKPFEFNELRVLIATLLAPKSAPKPEGAAE